MKKQSEPSSTKPADSVEKVIVRVPRLPVAVFGVVGAAMVTEFAIRGGGLAGFVFGGALAGALLVLIALCHFTNRVEVQANHIRIQTMTRDVSIPTDDMLAGRRQEQLPFGISTKSVVDAAQSVRAAAERATA